MFLQRGLDLPVPFPDSEDRRINYELHEERCNDPAYHWRGDSLHHISAAPRGPHQWQQSEEHAGHGHDLGPEPFDGTMNDGLAQIVPTAHLALVDRIVVGDVEVEQHEHRGLCIHAQKRMRPTQTAMLML